MQQTMQQTAPRWRNWRHALIFGLPLGVLQLVNPMCEFSGGNDPSELQG